jgi:exodeoxyribonuclease VII small subunit
MSGKTKDRGQAGGARQFEKILGKLEEIVEKLGQGEVSLEESLRLFEEGVTLSKEGHRILDDAESKIEVLLESGETREVAPGRKQDGDDE